MIMNVIRSIPTTDRPLDRTQLFRAGLAAVRAALISEMILAAVAGEPEAMAGSVSVATAVELGPFQRFLVNPPWIKYTRFRRSGNQEPTMSVKDGKPFANPSPWAHYEGALLPNGFFLRHLAYTTLYYDPKISGELVYNPPKPGEEWTVGASDRLWWQLDESDGVMIVAPQESEPGHSDKNGLEIIVKRQKRLLEVLRCLGMPELVDAEVEWLDATHFQATSWQHGKIEGTITRWHDDLAEELEYRVGRRPEQRLRMRYAYSPQRRLPPVEMVRTVVEENSTRSFTNIVDQWEEGLDPQHPDGFKASEFRRKTEPLQFFLVWSNGVRFKMAQDGTLARTSETPPDFAEFTRSGSDRVTGAVLVVSATVLLGALMGVWRIRQKNLQNRKTKQL